MNKSIEDIWERLHGIALGTGNITREISDLTKSINFIEFKSNYKGFVEGYGNARGIKLKE